MRPRSRIDKRLTVREGRVAFMIFRGLSNSQIADKLHVSVRTVKTHVVNIFNKLNIQSRVLIASYIGRWLGRKEVLNASRNRSK